MIIFSCNYLSTLNQNCYFDSIFGYFENLIVFSIQKFKIGWGKLQKLKIKGIENK